MKIETRFDIDQIVYPIVRLISGNWYRLDEAKIRAIQITKHGIYYRVNGNLYSDGELFASAIEADEMCLHYSRK